jgi:hypothetical protein
VIYTGEWREDEFHGQGSLVRDGSSFCGHFERGELLHGRGVLVNDRGDRYEGEIFGGVESGRGTIVAKNSGLRYEGEWLEGVVHGSGTWYYPNGKQFAGTFQQGAPVSGMGYLPLTNRSWYEGAMEQGQRHGFGTYGQREGSVVLRWEGSWEHGRRQGVGVLTCSDDPEPEAREFREDEEVASLTPEQFRAHPLCAQFTTVTSGFVADFSNVPDDSWNVDEIVREKKVKAKEAVKINRLNQLKFKKPTTKKTATNQATAKRGNRKAAKNNNNNNNNNSNSSSTMSQEHFNQLINSVMTGSKVPGDGMGGKSALEALLDQVTATPPKKPL